MEFFWEANTVRDGQDFFHFLWNLKVEYCDLKNPPLVLIIIQMNPVHTPKSLFLKDYFNIITVSSYLTFKYQENNIEMMAPCTNVRNLMCEELFSPVTVAMQSKVCTVIYHSDTGIVCLNLTYLPKQSYQTWIDMMKETYESGGTHIGLHWSKLLYKK
jgi:hypothetical protein